MNFIPKKNYLSMDNTCQEIENFKSITKTFMYFFSSLISFINTYQLIQTCWLKNPTSGPGVQKLN